MKSEQEQQSGTSVTGFDHFVALCFHFQKKHP